MSRDSDKWLGIFLGFLGLVALANYLENKQCRKCRRYNSKNAYICKYCGESLS